MIYFIQAGKHGQIKIGYTDSNPVDRLRSLQVGNPLKLRLVGVVDGTKQAEKDLHHRLREYRVNGEWFEPNNYVKHTIIQLCDNAPQDEPFDDNLTISIGRKQAINAFEKRYLSALLSKHGGRINKAAKEADISPRQFHKLMSKYKLKKNNFRNVEFRFEKISSDLERFSEHKVPTLPG